MGDPNNRHNLKRLAACALWIGAWQAASLVVGSKILLASPIDTCASLVRIVCRPDFLAIVWFSFSRISAGFLAAFALGVALGFAAHRLGWVRELLAPLVLAFKSIPVACIVVLLLIWVGSREVSGLAVFMMAFPALYLATLEGLGQVDKNVSDMLRTFGVDMRRQLLAHVWPSVLPYLVATSKNACGMAWKAGVAAELIGSPLGSLGERIYQAKILLETADLFAWTVVVVAVSYLCERLFMEVLHQTGPLAVRLSVPRKGAVTEIGPEPGRIVVRDAALGHGSDVAVDGVSLELAAGARGVLGDVSGTGKTTLIHTLSGLLPALAGTVEAPRSLSVVFQEARLVEALTAEENVLLVGAGGLSEGAAHLLLAELLDEDALGRPVSELSGGQRRRVEIARAVAHPSQALLCDEPFASLDAASHREAAAFVLRHLAGRTLLVASHAAEDVELLDAERLSLAGEAASS